jgi:acyl-CoA thioesterase-1
MNAPRDARESYGPILLIALALAAASLATGCYEDLCPQLEALPDAGAEPGILVVGDSIMASHGQLCQGVAGHAALALERSIEDHSLGGRRLDHPDSDDDVTGQYEPGPWEWVVMTGGGNDLLQECECNVEGHDEQACWDVMDSLLDAELSSGELLDFLALVEADPSHAATVLLLGYYPFMEQSWANFDGCNGYLPELNARYAALAEQREDLIFVSTEATMDLEAHPERIFVDGIHPSVEGAQALGMLVAETIRSTEPPR